MIKKLENLLLTVVILVYIIFEELIWERFAQPIIDYIKELRILKKLEIYLQGVNSKIILVVFLSMFVIVEFQGIYAGALFLEGKILHGTLLYAGKIPIAAFTFWLFGVSKEKLLEFGWFKKSYYFIVGLIDIITHSKVYINIKQKTAKIKAYTKETFFQGKGVWQRKIKVIYAKLKALLKV
jgi:hypothetical protein